MMLRLSLFLSLFGCLLPSVTCVYLLLEEGVEKCFIEDVPKETLISVEWKFEDMTRGGDLKMFVRSPEKKLLFQKLLSNGGRDEFGARDFGEYEICFQASPHNKAAWGANKAQYKLTLDIESGAEAIDYDKLANAEDLTNIQVTLRHISNQLRGLKKRQSYSRQLAVEHSELAEMTNDQIVYWSVIETLVLIGLSVYQVHYLKKFFVSKKIV